MTLKHISITPEKQAVLDKLTFGFEIEGYFARTLQDLNLKSSYGKRRARYQQDGSVHVSTSDAPFSEFAITGNATSADIAEQDEQEYRIDCDYCDGNGDISNECDCYEEGNTNLICDIVESESEAHEHDDECYEPMCQNDDDYHVSDCYECSGRGWFNDDEYQGDNNPATEYASAVFSDLSLALDDLERFNNKTHLYNESCGLHFHIGTRSGRDQKKLWALVGNMEFLKSLHDLALTFCKCQKERLENTTRFCEFYETPENLIAEFQNSEKYRFVRFHKDYDTLEFRFFTPCKHKVENVQKLVNAILDFAITSESYHAEAKTDDTEHVENILLPVKIASTSELEARSKKSDQLFSYFNDLRKRVARLNNTWQYIWNEYANSEEILKQELSKNNGDHFLKMDDYLLRAILTDERTDFFISAVELREAKRALDAVVEINNEPVIIQTRAYNYLLKQDKPQTANEQAPVYGRSDTMLNFFIDYNGKRKINAPVVLSQAERDARRAEQRQRTRMGEYLGAVQTARELYTSISSNN